MTVGCRCCIKDFSHSSHTRYIGDEWAAGQALNTWPDEVPSGSVHSLPDPLVHFLATQEADPAIPSLQKQERESVGEGEKVCGPVHAC